MTNSDKLGFIIGAGVSYAILAAGVILVIWLCAWALGKLFRSITGRK